MGGTSTSVHHRVDGRPGGRPPSVAGERRQGPRPEPRFAQVVATGNGPLQRGKRYRPRAAGNYVTSRLTIKQPFDPAHILEMGQAFRWRRLGDENLGRRDWGNPPAFWLQDGGGWYSGVLEGCLCMSGRWTTGWSTGWAAGTVKVRHRPGPFPPPPLPPRRRYRRSLHPPGTAPGGCQRHRQVPGVEGTPPGAVGVPGLLPVLGDQRHPGYRVLRGEDSASERADGHA